ncbi:hypothetical protein DRO49_01355 [Candidatus Bathyarchaeota archaeon]|nr:MAG: hypothetical protein DRO49_01355 [Candidatus Bathyarchaeota archaeon]
MRVYLICILSIFQRFYRDDSPTLNCTLTRFGCCLKSLKLTTTEKPCQQQKAYVSGNLKISVHIIDSLLLLDFHIFEGRFIGKEPEKCLEMALHFESADEKENEKLMDYFVARKEEIKQKIGEEIFFERLGKKWRSIYTRKEVKTLDDALANEEVKRWAVDTMVKFYDTLKPLLDKAVREIRG